MSKPLVLVVDDDPGIRRMVGVLLGGGGYQVAGAGDAYQRAHAGFIVLPVCAGRRRMRNAG